MEHTKKVRQEIMKLSEAKTPEEFTKLWHMKQGLLAEAEKVWFRSSKEESDVSSSSNDDYLEPIFSYINKAISMCIKAIPKKRLTAIELTFSQDGTEQTEPIICMHFESETVSIVIDNLWKSELDFDRELKNGCVTLAQMIWPEYRATVSKGQLEEDMQKICTKLCDCYQTIQISYTIQP